MIYIHRTTNVIPSKVKEYNELVQKFLTFLLMSMVSWIRTQHFMLWLKSRNCSHLHMLAMFLARLIL